MTHSTRSTSAPLRARLGAATLAMALAAPAFGSATVLYDDTAVTIDETLADPTDLWVRPKDLERVNGFELKPQGACLDEICIPVRQDTDSDLFVRRGGKSWFNVTELAKVLRQPVAADYDASVFSLGAIPVQRVAFTENAIAPDFELVDGNGQSVRLSDFKGKKIMLLTWASW